MMTKVTPVLVDETQTSSVVTRDVGEKENAPEFTALEASVAFATFPSITEYTTEPSACQIEPTPTLEEIENEIAAAAHARIEAALADLNETRARIERERAARENALKAAQQRADATRSDRDRLASERAEMEHRALAFLVGDLLKATLEKIHLAFNVRQLELEDALAVAEADVQETQTEIQAATISDALELQLTEQHLDQLEAIAPEVATTVRLAADAAANLAAALQAAKEGLLSDAKMLLEKAKAGNSDPTQMAEVEHVLTEAQRAKIARDLIAQMNAIAERPGAVRRIRKLIEEAEAAGVTESVASHAQRALNTARRFSKTRYAQAKPIAEHLASQGFVPVVGDGRIEAWKQVARNGASSHTSRDTVWTLGRIVSLRHSGEWITETPRNPITQKELPMRVRHSRWFRLAEAHPIR